MVRSLSARTSYGVFVIAAFILVVSSFLQREMSVETHAQQPLKTASASIVPAGGARPESSDDVFLGLADSVGQLQPAKRLVEYKLRHDPSSRPRYWGIVDFAQRSTTKRFYVFDTVGKKIATYLVSHGRGSEGPSDDGVAEIFSNNDGSFSSSLGIYRTLDEYTGKHGRSLRLEGLEETNSNARSRAVVLHTADYVSEAFIQRTGRLGRSEGCFAVDKAFGDTLIDQLKSGAYLIAWKE